MAATDLLPVHPHAHPGLASDLALQSMLLTATLGLQGVSPQAIAETVPERGIISFKALNYQDRQNHNADTASGASASYGKNRIKVDAQSLLVAVPIAGEWLLSGSYTADAITGASPRFHASNLTRMNDYRDAYQVNLKRYFERGTLAVGANLSSENDYLSRGYSIAGTLDSDNRNTTFNAGVSVSNDDINPTGHVLDYVEHKHSLDWIVGVTQVLTVNDLVQVNIGISTANGYFDDPYKSGDRRPRSKDRFTIAGRWNHYVEQTGGTTHLGYRYYSDTFGVDAHSLSVEYDQPMAHGWMISPLFRLYTQTAADFYVGPNDLAGISGMRYLSLDQRLSAFGALTYGVKVSKQLNQDWDVDFKIEAYKQKQNWALSGSQGGDLEPFSYRAIQVGISRKF